MFGPGGISIWQLLIILVIVVLLFGTKKIRGMGGDLGAAIKSFRKSVKDESEKEETTEAAEEDVEQMTSKTESEAEKNKA